MPGRPLDLKPRKSTRPVGARARCRVDQDASSLRSGQRHGTMLRRRGERRCGAAMLQVASITTRGRTCARMPSGEADPPAGREVGHRAARSWISTLPHPPTITFCLDHTHRRPCRRRRLAGELSTRLPGFAVPRSPRRLGQSSAQRCSLLRLHCMPKVPIAPRLNAIPTSLRRGAMAVGECETPEGVQNFVAGRYNEANAVPAATSPPPWDLIPAHG